MTTHDETLIAYGALENGLNKTVDSFSAKRVLLVTGKDSFERSGAAEIVGRKLGARIVGRFTDFEKNPTISDVEKGVVSIEQSRPDLILAIGGGSALDVAKQMNTCSTNDLAPRAYITGKEKPKHPGLPLIACPTTAGTGSEATHFAVCYDGMNKYSFAHPRMKPNAVIIDPLLAASLATYQAACCAFDALGQLIESYWAVAATNESRQYAREGLQLLIPAIKPSVLNGDYDARIQMAKAAHLSGKAINISKTTAAHALSYPIAKICNIPHGHAVAMTLPELFLENYNTNDNNCNHCEGADFIQKIIIEITKILGFKKPEDGALYLNELATSLGLERDRQVLSLNMQAIVSHVNVERLGNNPKSLNQIDLNKLLYFKH